MFLIQSLAVLSFAYWCSALVGELVFTSREEAGLPAPIRACLGLVFVTVYFSAAWQLISISQAWLLGIGLLAMHAFADRDRLRALRAGWKALASAHLAGYLACLAGGLLFFLPSFMVNSYGPFTEGGGDVTIYSDTAKLLTDKDLTAFGQPSNDLGNIAPNVAALLDVTNNEKFVKYAHVKESFLERFAGKLNPPVADVDAYRTVADIFFSSVFYAPYAQFYFLSGATNYPVFYGMEAFFYACLLLGVWYLFARFGLLPALLATAVVASSHSVVSVFYNTYSMQGICMAISALFACLVPVMRKPVSLAGLRAFGPGAVFIWLCYPHYVSVVGGLLLIVAAGAIGQWRRADPIDAEQARPRRSGLLAWLPGSVLAVLVVLLVAGGTGKAVEFLRGLLSTFVHGNKNFYLGDQIAPWTLRWTSFLFGLISQQHVQPFAMETPWVMGVVHAGAILGVACLLLGIVAMARLELSPPGGERPPGVYVAMYVAILLTVALHIYLAQSSLYTQAKGAQNVLVILYAALVLPVGLALRSPRRDRVLASLTIALGVALAAFTVTLFVPRLVYAYRLAHREDRGSILEASYFSEARRIRLEDSDPFVLFEPRKSADLYVSIQPFSGARMVPTRHLALEKVVPWVSKKRVIASDLITDGDIAHLWLLSSLAPAKSGGPSAWRAERLLSGRSPRVYLFGDDYEESLATRPRGPDGADQGAFSYLRNGAAMLFLRAGDAASVEARIVPRDPARFAEMLAEVSQRMARGELARPVELEHDGTFVILRYRISAADAPRLLQVARYGGEFWLNVRLDGRELAHAPGERAAQSSGAKVSGHLAGAATISATWSGIASPGKDDWIGLFPLNGGDASRMAFGFTGGRSSGVMSLQLPPGMGPDSARYELRLFSAGSWNRLATSAPITLHTDSRKP